MTIMMPGPEGAAPRLFADRFSGLRAAFAPRGPGLPWERRRKPLTALAPSLGRSGSLEVRLAAGAREVMQAQRLRYQVFYEEGAAVAGPLCRLSRLDRDGFDAACDHLLVLDHGAGRRGLLANARPKVVGTYRLLRQDVAERHRGFYSAAEFDLGPLIAAHPDRRFLELGRSCVLAPYRTRKTIELLWHGIWAYALQHGIDVMIGCASLEGTDPARLALPLAFLHHHAGIGEEWLVRALPERYQAMNLMAPAAIDPRQAVHRLPPLLKAYLRLGARFADGAVVDHQFGTTDVLVVLPVEAIAGRYLGYFGREAERYAA